MPKRPTTLSPARERALDADLDDLRLRLLDCVERLLREVPREPLRELLYGLAFEPSDALPKRSHRPKVENAYLVQQVYRAHAPAGDDLDDLLAFTVAVTEYYDIFDDVVDGDVAAGRRADAVIAMQLLMPLFLRRIHAFGDDAVAFWTERALELMAGPLTEVADDPTAAAYRAVVDDQATLFGFVTGLAALAADAPPDAVDRAETVGELYYVYEQYLTDLEQYGGGDGPWNLWHLTTEAEGRARVTALREALAEAVADLPAERAAGIRALAAHDLDAMLESVTEP